MPRVKQTLSCKVPLVAFAMVVLHTLPSCGKTTAPSEAESIPLAPAMEVAVAPSLTGKVILTGGKPSSLGQVIDVGDNPFCSGHPQLINPTWRVAGDGGLANAVVTIRRSPRASNDVSAPAVINQTHCEFEPHLTVLQPGQSAQFHNGDLTFHNVRLIRHTAGTRGEGQNLENFGQPAQGDENVKGFNAPGIYRLECDVHRWMKAWVYVHDGIHAAATREDGSFTINRALADGFYEVEVWHPQFAEKLTQTVTVHNGTGEAKFEFNLAKSFDP
jgi:plastocyanin